MDAKAWLTRTSWSGDSGPQIAEIRKAGRADEAEIP
jgi:hypothetical protein